MRNLARSFVRARDGSVAVTMAFATTALLSISALALDSGLAYTHKRRQQAATDMAALSAASNLSTATRTATSVATSNGFGATDVSAVEMGTYQPNLAIAPSSRFSTPPTGAVNAVRITMSKQHGFLFGSLLDLVSGNRSLHGTPVVTRSIATLRNAAAFSLGSGLAALNNGVVNGMLSAMVGSSVSLSAADTQALITTRVDLFSMSRALATRIGLTGATFNDVAAASITPSTAMAAMADSIGAGPASQVLNSLRMALSTQTRRLTLGQLVSFGPYGGVSVSDTPLTVQAGAFDILSALLQASNGNRQVDAPIAVSLPGVASATVSVVIGQPVSSTSFLTLAPQGATLTTAQIRLRLTLQLSGPAPAPTMMLPIVLDLAPATATLSNISCPVGLPSASVQLAVTPGIANGWIGAVPDADLDNLAVPLNPPAATLINLAGILTTTGRAHTVVANTSPTTVSFSYPDVQAGTRKTVSTTDYTASLLAGLFNTTQLSTSVFGMAVINTPAFNSSVTQVLLNDAASIDTVLASALSTLGVTLGNATVSVDGVACGQPVLVN